MSKLFAALGAAMLLTVTSATSAMSVASAQEMPNLLGIWQGPFQAQMISGTTSGNFTLIIDNQDEELFSGQKIVDRTDSSSELTSAGGAMVRNPLEAFIGVISADGTEFHLAEVGDPGWYAGRIIDADTIEVTYVESGAVPVVHRTMLERQE